MAADHWRTGTDLNVLLHANSQMFEFAQAIRLLSAQKQQPLSLDSIDQALRFSCHDGDEFMSSEVTAVRRMKDRRQQMVISFFGLLGQHSPLPQPYQHWVRENAANDDMALKDFLDIFNHRLIGLLFMVLARHRPGLDANSPALSNQGKFINALIGLGLEDQKAQLPIAIRGVQAFGGLLANRKISVARIQKILQGDLKTSVFVKQFIGDWMPLAGDQCTRITAAPTHTGKRLGRDAVLGNRAWNQTAGIALYIGPMKWGKLVKKLPGGESYSRLRDLVLHLTENRWPIDIHLLLEPNSIPPTTLNHSANARVALGNSTWLRTRSPRFKSMTDQAIKQLPTSLRKKLGDHPTCTTLRVVPEHKRYVTHG